MDRVGGAFHIRFALTGPYFSLHGRGSRGSFNFVVRSFDFRVVCFEESCQQHRVIFFRFCESRRMKGLKHKLCSRAFFDTFFFSFHPSRFFTMGIFRLLHHPVCSSIALISDPLLLQ
jgi:hypothetical protein